MPEHRDLAHPSYRTAIATAAAGGLLLAVLLALLALASLSLTAL